MPLENAKEGTPGFSRNIAREIRAGKPPKQAEAIAYSKARGDEDDDLNTERSGGQFNVLRRKLQNFTLKKHTNGRYLVIDNKTGRTAGAGYATPEAAVRAFENEDYRRTTGRYDNMSNLDSAIASCDSIAARTPDLAQKRDELERKIIRTTSQVQQLALRKELSRVEDKLHGRSDGEHEQEVKSRLRSASDENLKKALQAAKEAKKPHAVKLVQDEIDRRNSYGTKNDSRLDSATQTAAQLHERMNLRPGAAKDADEDKMYAVKIQAVRSGRIVVFTMNARGKSRAEAVKNAISQAEKQGDKRPTEFK